MIRYAALGDSITLGLGDRMPDGTWRGWASLLAQALAEPGGVRLRNLATTGARAADVAADQLLAALALRPHLASVIVGVNDTLRNRFDLAATGRALSTTIAALAGSGALVLTIRLPDPGRMLGMPNALARPLGRRIRAINAVTDALAVRYRTVHFNADGNPSVYDRRMWSVDRLHPAERGHRLIAHAYATSLIDRGFPVRSVPGLEPSNPDPTRLAQLWWLATRGSRWIADRATDLVPDLTRLAALEYWYRLRGLSTMLDHHLERDVVAALTASLECRPPEPV
jgi:lysophospholipase L1-like esterase